MLATAARGVVVVVVDGDGGGWCSCAACVLAGRQRTGEARTGEVAFGRGLPVELQVI